MLNKHFHLFHPFHASFSRERRVTAWLPAN